MFLPLLRVAGVLFGQGSNERVVEGLLLHSLLKPLQREFLVHGERGLNTAYFPLSQAVLEHFKTIINFSWGGELYLYLSATNQTYTR